MIKYILLLLLTLTLQATDKYYSEGMEYFLGNKGIRVYSKDMFVKCPYKFCKDSLSENRVKLILKDYKSAIKLFKLSVIKKNNIEAAEKGLLFLTKQLNWKEKNHSTYLISRFHERIGEGYEFFNYKEDFIFFTDFLESHHNILGYYTKGKMYENGVLGVNLNIIKSNSLYSLIKQECNKKMTLQCHKILKDI